jgi:hypothetical protein
MRSGGFDMRGGSGEAVAVAASSPSKNNSALDVMRYRPEINPLPILSCSLLVFGFVPAEISRSRFWFRFACFLLFFGLALPAIRSLVYPFLCSLAGAPSVLLVIAD